LGAALKSDALFDDSPLGRHEVLRLYSSLWATHAAVDGGGDQLRGHQLIVLDAVLMVADESVKLAGRACPEVIL
jgi:hypothetical protein